MTMWMGHAYVFLLPGLGALGAAIGAAQPVAGERTVGIDGHERDHRSALDRVGHRQHIVDELADADEICRRPNRTRAHPTAPTRPRRSWSRCRAHRQGRCRSPCRNRRERPLSGRASAWPPRLPAARTRPPPAFLTNVAEMPQPPNAPTATNAVARIPAFLCWLIVAKEFDTPLFIDMPPASSKSECVRSPRSWTAHSLRWRPE